MFFLLGAEYWPYAIQQNLSGEASLVLINIVMEHCVKKDKEPALGLYDNGTKAWPKDTQDTDSD